MNQNDPKQPDFDVRYSERFKRRQHFKNTRVFFVGAWLLMFLAIGLAQETLEGLRTGEWVYIGSDSDLAAPWWVAAMVASAIVLLSLWCFYRYLRLKATEPHYEPGDEINDDE